MQNIRASRRDIRCNCFCILIIRSCQAHFRQKLCCLLAIQLDSNRLVDTAHLCVHRSCHQRGIVLDCSVSSFHVYFLDGEWLSTILRKHRHHGINYNLCLRQIGGRALNENILRRHRDLRVIAVDNRRKGKHDTVGILDDGVDRRVADDRQVVAEVRVLFVELHQGRCFEALLLVQRNKLDIFRGKSIIGEGALDGVKIVCTNRDE
mmetsp:Transcript_32791/g.84685  ORF Transcript_32791/g.84685 Transcript_32791/m.84685 type:complete len:206 (+) Transcript_32791:1736-2353(+)